jgi:endonuclease YncB( thermonuclease family)
MDRSRFRISLLLGLLLVSILAPASRAYIRTIEGFVTQVFDGDTLTLEKRDGTKLRVRLYGIDAPEIRHDRKSRQPFSEEARWALAEKVLRKSVILTVLERDKDKRMVGIITLGKRSINEEMVREGWAWAYRKDLRGPYVGEFIDAERVAREKKLGLWQQANPQPPWEYRRSTRP